MSNKKSIKRIASLLLVAIALIGMIQINVLSDEYVRGTIYTYEGEKYKVESQNLLPLGDFDDPNYVVDFWDGNKPRTDAVYYISQAGSFTQDAAYKGGYGYEFPGGSTLIYRTTVEPGSTYVFTMYVKVPEGSDANFSESFRHIATDGTYHGYIEIGRKTPITHGWQKEEIVFEAANSEFRFYVVNSGSDVMYIDQLNLQKLTPITSPIRVNTSGPRIQQIGYPTNYLRQVGFKPGNATLSYEIIHQYDTPTDVTFVAGLYDGEGKLVHIGATSEEFVRFEERKVLNVNLEIPDVDLTDYRIRVFLLDSLKGLNKYVSTSTYGSEKGIKDVRDYKINGFNYITSAEHDDLALTFLGGPNLVGWRPFTGGDDQQWFIYEKAGSPGVYYIYTKKEPARHLNIDGESTSPGARIIAYGQASRGVNEEWMLQVANADAKTYRIFSPYSSLYVAMSGTNCVQQALDLAPALYIEAVED